MKKLIDILSKKSMVIVKHFLSVIFLTTLVLVVWTIWYPDFWSNANDQVLVGKWDLVEGELHKGDLLQLNYLSWSIRDNIAHLRNPFFDYHIFQDSSSEPFKNGDLGVLMIVCGLVSYFCTFEMSWNISFILIPLILTYIGTFLFFNEILKSYLISCFLALLPVFYPFRLTMHLMGHQSGAYAFLFPWLFFVMVKIENDCLNYKDINKYNIFLFIILVLGIVSEQHIGYYLILISSVWILLKLLVNILYENKLPIIELVYNTRIVLFRYWGVSVSIIFAFFFGLWFNNFILAQGHFSNDMPISVGAFYSFTWAEIQAYFSKSFFLWVAALSIFLRFLIVFFGKGKPNTIFSPKGLFWLLFALTVFFTYCSFGLKEPFASNFPLITLFRDYLPYFNKQKVFNKMFLPVPFLSFLLITWICFHYVKELTIRKGLRLVFTGVLIFLVVFQLNDFSKDKGNFAWAKIQGPVYSGVVEFIKRNTTRNELILDLPIISGVDPYDGKSLHFAMLTGRRFMGGYHGNSPIHKLRTTLFCSSSLFSGKYQGRSFYAALELLKESKIKTILIDKNSPGFSPTVIEGITQKPFFTLFYEDKHAAVIKLIHEIDLSKQKDFRDYSLTEGFDLPESGFAKFGNWMTGKIGFIAIPNLVKGRKYALNFLLGSLDRNSVELGTGVFKKHFNIHSGLNNLTLAFQATGNQAKIMILVGHTVKAGDHNTADNRDLGLFFIDAQLQETNS